MRSRSRPTATQRAHSTPQIARNPLTGELVIAEAEVRTRKTCDIHISVDDGRSWFDGDSPMTKPFTDCSLQATNGPYITLQFTPDGTLFAGFFGSDPKFSNELNRNDIPRHVFLARSEDSGRTWKFLASLVTAVSLGDCGYPSTVQLADGTLVSAYYSSKASHHHNYHMAVIRWHL